MLLGTCLRMLATLPPYEASLLPRTKFWLVFAANMMVNTGHPVLITMSTKVRVRGGCERVKHRVPTLSPFLSAQGAHNRYMGCAAMKRLGTDFLVAPATSKLPLL